MAHNEPSHLDLQCLQIQPLLCLVLYGLIFLPNRSISYCLICTKAHCGIAFIAYSIDFADSLSKEDALKLSQIAPNNRDCWNYA